MPSKKPRACFFSKEENCSIVQIKDNEAYLFNHKIYHTDNNFIIDYVKDRALIFVNNNRENSLNQDPNQPLEETKSIMYVPMNVLIEITKAFEEIDNENLRRVNSLEA